MQLKYSNYVAFSHFHGKAVNNSGLGNNYKNKVEHIGAHPGFDVTETLILQCECKAHIISPGDSHQEMEAFLMKYAQA